MFRVRCSHPVTHHLVLAVGPVTVGGGELVLVLGPVNVGGYTLVAVALNPQCYQ